MSMKKYLPAQIEKKWQKKWAFEVKSVSNPKKKFYKLVEFPYPSGNLHMGHWYSYSVPDIYARFKQMQGYDVMYQMGFDAFGLPAENAAINRGIHPDVWTKQNIKHMRKQMESMGAMFDWSRMVSTIDPDYYRWTQWIFLQFYKAGLAYRAKTNVNWCPKDKTVLANEQVVDDKCDRCGTEVEQREREQWMYRITKYADQLLEGLDRVDWPEVTKTAQRNWIGKSEGAVINFEIRMTNDESNSNVQNIEIFTTRPDTIFGATYLVLAPEHELTSRSDLDVSEEVRAYCEQAKRKTALQRQESKEKTGVELKDMKAINPANGEEIPIWVADYVLGNYGTGAIMAVPAHDERDGEFAKKFNLTFSNAELVDTEKIIKSLNQESKTNCLIVHGCPSRKEDMMDLSNGRHDKHWMPWLRSRLDESGIPTKIVLMPEPWAPSYEAWKKEFEKNEVNDNTILIGHSCGSAFLVHWLGETKRKIKTLILVGPWKIARSPEKQRFYDFDISSEIKKLTSEIIYFTSDTEKEDGKKSLEMYYKILGGKIVSLPNRGHYTFEDMGTDEFPELLEELGKYLVAQKKTTYRLHDWILSRQRYWGTPIPMIFCKDCGYQPVGEEDLPVKLPKLDNYLPADDGSSPLARAEKWVNTKCPQCGKSAQRETDTMDTFVDSSWYFLRYTDPHNKNEFASKEKMAEWLPVDLYTGGAEHNTMHLLYSRFFIKAMHELGLVDFDEPFKVRRNHGTVLGPDGAKMSKSKGNVIDPDKEVAEFGADAVRMYLAFLGPYDTFNGPWAPHGIVGISRFLQKIWKLAHNDEIRMTNDESISQLHKTIKKVGEDIENLHFNTAISELMKFLNSFDIRNSSFDIFLKLLAPFAPHLAEDLWSRDHATSIHLEPWPVYDPNRIVESTVQFVIQINGKTRGMITLPVDSDESVVRSEAEKDEKLKKYFVSPVKKTIFIPKKLINFIL